MRNLIIILLLSFFGHSHAQKDASDYFNAAALLYVNKYDDACKNKIKEGLQKFPTDYRLLALGKKVGYEPESNDCDRDDDRDGIKNCKDKCPNVFGTTANNGCPIVLEGEGEEVIIDLNFLRGDGNKVSWSKDIANKAKSITITFIDEDGKKWVDKENVTGNSYIYNPGDGRAGDKSTQVILSIIMEKGVKVKGPLTLNNQYFKCRSEN